MHLCNRKTARTKPIVVVNLISHKQLCRNNLHSRNKVVFKADCLFAKVSEFTVSSLHTHRKAGNFLVLQCCMGTRKVYIMM